MLVIMRTVFASRLKFILKPLTILWLCRCVEKDDLHQAEVVIKRNGDSLLAEFKFRVFQLLESSFDGEEKIYVHVVAHLCDEIFEGECSLVSGGNMCRATLVLRGNSNDRLLCQCLEHFY